MRRFCALLRVKLLTAPTVVPVLITCFIVLANPAAPQINATQRSRLPGHGAVRINPRDVPAMVRADMAMRGLPLMGRSRFLQLSQRPRYAPNQFNVKFAPAAWGKARKALSAQVGGRVLSEINELNIQTLVLTAAQVKAYKADPNVLWIEPNAMRYPLTLTPNDFGYNTLDSNLPIDPSLATWYKWDTHLIDAADAWSIWPNKFFTAAGGKGSDAVRIAVIDTGVDYSHPDFMNTGGSSTDVLTGGGQLYQSLDETIFGGVVTPMAPDGFGHGTHVTGIAAAATNNQIGTVGNGYNAQVISLRVTDDNGNGSSSDLASAIVYAANNGAVAINCSLGDYSYSQAEKNAVDYAWSLGTLVIAAAGNDGGGAGPSPTIYPAALSRVLAVAATAYADTPASYSSVGDWVGTSAPGGDFDLTLEWFVDVWSTMPTYPVTLNGPDFGLGMNYDYLEGTSMASPQMTGAAALYAGMLGITRATPGAPLLLFQALQQCGDDIDGSGGWDPNVGWGRLNLFNLMNLANVPNPRGDTVGGIIGQVTYKGTPVQNADVIATPVGGGAPFEGTSNSDGSYRIPDIGVGTYSVTATYFGDSATQTAVTVSPGCDMPGVDLNIDSTAQLTNLTVAPSSVVAPGTATGTVTISSPAPAAGTVVTVGSINPSVANPATSTVTVPSGATTKTFTINTFTPSSTTTVTITASVGPVTDIASLTVSSAPINSAQMVTQTVPSSMTAGQTYPVSVTMTNTGNTTWMAGTGYKLGSQNPQDNTVWGFSRVIVPNTTPPGQQVKFSFNVTAPPNNGTYNFQWQMLQASVAWFGSQTTNVPVTVLGGGSLNGATFVSQNVPSSMAAGQTYQVSITMQNTGTTTWTGGLGYKLGSQNPTSNTTWGLNRVVPSQNVAPGQQVTFTFNVSAPVYNGTYNFQWQMLQTAVAWFGSMTPNVAVTVTGGPSGNNSAFVSQTVSTSMTAGQSYQVSLTYQNTGGTTWTIPGGYKIGSQNLQDNQTWGLYRVGVPHSVAPGQNVTFTFNVTAPPNNGTYNFQWETLQSGVAWFGAKSTNVAVTVSGGGSTNNASFVSQNVPATMTHGQTYQVSITMQNTGTTTWTSALLYELGSQNPQNNTTWGTNRLVLPQTTTPGNQVTFTFNVTAPSAPGSYNFQWKMLESGVAWFGAATPNVSVTVN